MTEEREPRPITRDVAAIVRKLVGPAGEADGGTSVRTIAMSARPPTSARTVYRILANSTETISLELGDRVALAAGGHLSECRCLFPDGTIRSYLS